MRKIRKMAACLFLFAVVMALAPVRAQAKVTKAVDPGVGNVRRVQELEGRWVKKRGRYRFRQLDGKIAKKKWFRAGNRVYYVNAKGNRVSGWVSCAGQTYYMDKDGKLCTGWLKVNRKTYFLIKKNGRMAKGLRKVKGATYYFDPESGERKTGWLSIGKARYYFDSSGKMATDRWIKKGKKYYYVDASGKKARSGWLTLGDKTYYLDKKGARVTGSVVLDGVTYYFDSNGVYLPDGPGKKIDSSKPMVALTFDDGPGKYTDRLLNCLEKYDAKATFFMVGTNVPNYKSTVKRMAELGCELGSHSYSHAYFTGLSRSAMYSEVSKANAAIKEASGQYPTVFRLPYGDGASNSAVLSALGLPSIYWSVDTRDWANTGNPQHTVNEVLNNVRSGDIVLMHDIHYSSVVAAETIIPSLLQRGYQLVTVSELAKYKGKTTLQNGKTYRGFR